MAVLFGRAGDFRPLAPWWVEREGKAGERIVAWCPNEDHQRWLVAALEAERVPEGYEVAHDDGNGEPFLRRTAVPLSEAEWAQIGREHAEYCFEFDAGYGTGDGLPQWRRAMEEIGRDRS